MKYVVVEVEIKNDMVLEVPVIFPNHLIHKDMADALIEVLRKGFPKALIQPVSAGDINSAEINANCYGNSTSLHLSAREGEDKILIQANDYGAGFR